MYFPLATLGMLIQDKMDTFVYSNAGSTEKDEFHENSLEDCNRRHIDGPHCLSPSCSHRRDSKKFGRTRFNRILDSGTSSNPRQESL
jgi:hypothetical protein